MEIDQDLANRLYNQGAFFIFLNIPKGTEFGMDMTVWNTHENFRGIKMIPPGVHFIHYSAVSKTGERAPRSGFFHNFRGKELLVKFYDEISEDISNIPIKEEEIERLRESLPYMDASLGPYPYSTRDKWISFSNHISDELISELTPLSGIIRSALILLPCDDKNRPRGSAQKKSNPQTSNCKETSSTEQQTLNVAQTSNPHQSSNSEQSSDLNQTLKPVQISNPQQSSNSDQTLNVAQTSNCEQSSDLNQTLRSIQISNQTSNLGQTINEQISVTEQASKDLPSKSTQNLEPPSTSKSANLKRKRGSGEELLPDLKPVPGTEFRFTKFPKRKYPEGSTSAEITKHSLDSSYVLELVLKRHKNEIDLIGELQFAFICFFIGQNLDAFNYWRKLVGLICSCDEAIVKHRQIYDAFVEVLEAQIHEVPREFLADIVANNNFIYCKLRELFRTVKESQLDGRLKTKMDRFKNRMARNFDWDFGNLDEEDEDDAPVVVIIDE